MERLREEFEEEAAEIRAKSKREQEARAKALQERERKRAEQRTKLEEELAARESERHKQVLKLKEVLKEHADAKKRIAEEDAPEEGEVDLNPASARATPASGARGGSLAAHIASADNSRDGPSPSPHYRADGPAPSPHYRQDSNQGLDRWGSGTPGAGPGGWGNARRRRGWPVRPPASHGDGHGDGHGDERRDSRGRLDVSQGVRQRVREQDVVLPMWHSETGGTASETPHGRLGSLTRRGAMRRDETRMAFEASRIVIFISVEGVRASTSIRVFWKKFARLRYASLYTAAAPRASSSSNAATTPRISLASRSTSSSCGCRPPPTSPTACAAHAIVLPALGFSALRRHRVCVLLHAFISQVAIVQPVVIRQQPLGHGFEIPLRQSRLQLLRVFPPRRLCSFPTLSNIASNHPGSLLCASPA